jgi:DNA-binding beta-propeller fold protein YncE
VYVPTPQGSIAALDLATGVTARGWPVALFSTVRQDHLYSALTYNPANGLLYAETAGYCDKAPWHGRIAAIDTASRAIVATFYPGGKYGGAGIWGMGGVAIDARTNRVYAVTGNTAGKNESARYGEHALRLSPALDVLGANFPNVYGPDVDFGSTPMLFDTPHCPPRMIAKNKSGALVMWNPATLQDGPAQILQMAHDTETGQFIGVTAYSPKTQLVYVGNPHGAGFFKTGIDALGLNGKCQLYIAWERQIGEAATTNDNVAPAVANGVVYAAGGLTSKVWVFDAATGARLWNSGPAIGGPTFTPPVIDGLLFVPSWDHSLYAFGP